MNYGFKLSGLQEDHHILGGLDPWTDYPLLMPDGHGWGAYLPAPEVQSNSQVESMNCTNYGTNHALATVANFKKYDAFPKNCSERYTGIETGTTKDGNELHHVLEVIRTVCGEIPEISLPFNDSVTSWDEYYSPNPTGALRIFGSRLLKQFKIGHRWVINGTAWTNDKPDKIKHALQYSPLVVSVWAWKQRNGLYWKDTSDEDNHVVTLYDYVDGVKWLIFDSYDNQFKELEWNFNFFEAKNVYVDAIPFTLPKTWWDRLWDLFRQNGLLGAFRSTLGALTNKPT